MRSAVSSAGYGVPWARIARCADASVRCGRGYGGCLAARAKEPHPSFRVPNGSPMLRGTHLHFRSARF